MAFTASQVGVMEQVVLEPLEVVRREEGQSCKTHLPLAQPVGDQMEIQLVLQPQIVSLEESEALLFLVPL